MISSFDSTINAFHSFYFEILTDLDSQSGSFIPGKVKDCLETKLHLIVH